jgi:hypothetical protein
MDEALVTARRRRSIRRGIAMGSATLIALAMAATPAFAGGKPIREPVPAPEPTVFAAGDLCSFEVEIAYPINREQGLTFLDEDGEFAGQIITGRLTATVTNTQTGASISRNVSGPGFVSPLPDGGIQFVLGGTGLLYTFDTDATGAGVWFVSGQTVLTISSEGNVVGAQRHGRTEDVCAMLA